MTQALPQVPCYTSCGIVQDPFAEEIQLHPPIATPLDQLQVVDVAFDRPVRPGERQGSFDGFVASFRRRLLLDSGVLHIMDRT